MTSLFHSRGDKMMDIVKEVIRWQDFVMIEGIGF